MTERLADIDARVEGVRQLGAVVNAMRGIAAARAQQARHQLAAVDSYAQTIGSAIGQALEWVSPQDACDTAGAGRPALLVFGAEQGFAGAFSERVLDDAGVDLTTSQLFMVGTRGVAVAAGRGVKAGWYSAMPSHPSGLPALAERVAEALQARLAAGGIDRIDVVFHQWHSGHGNRTERRRLLPVDLALFPRPPGGDRPLTNLPPAALVAELAQDYLYAQICQAALHAFAAENEARMETMAGAHSQVERKLATLQAAQRTVRQEEITAEIMEHIAAEMT